MALAGGGFRDVTRIAASSPDVWLPILESNRSAVLSALKAFQNRCARLSESIAAGRWDEVRSFLDGSRAARVELFAKPSLGAEPVTLALTVPDKPGVLAEVTTAAGELGANIEDLRIIHSTEGGRGRLELAVAGDAAATALAESLLERGYRPERVQAVE